MGLVKAQRGDATNYGSAVTGLILSVLATLAAFFWIMAAGFAVSDRADADETSVSAPAAVQAADNVPAVDLSSKIGSEKVVKLGTPVSVPDFLGDSAADVTVDKFVAETESDNEFRTPQAGHKFVAAHVSVHNTGKKDYTNVAWVGAKVYTAAGQGHSADILSNSTEGPALPSSIDLKPGGKANGWVLFEVPVGEKLDSIAFDDAEWKL